MIIIERGLLEKKIVVTIGHEIVQFCLGAKGVDAGFELIKGSSSSS